MTKIRLKYVSEFRDRHGHIRRYFRRGTQCVTLSGLPGSAEFMDAYQAALATRATPKEPPAGTFSALIVAWYQSSNFRGLRASTQRVYRNIAERFREKHGHRPVKGLQTRQVRALLSEASGHPAAANNFLKVLRALMLFAVEQGWRDDDPCYSVRKVKDPTSGFHSWTEDEIALFEARWPVGTRARLAFDLLLYTGQRRADVVKMGRQHVRDGMIEIRQEKTGAEVSIPIHAKLAASIEAMPSNHLTYLTTEHGAAFTSAGFGNLFADLCRAAGVPDACRAHGLRKAAARRLAEIGCTTHEIMAITGHKTLAEVERYTRTVARRGLAVTAMARFKAESGTPTCNPSRKKSQPDE